MCTGVTCGTRKFHTAEKLMLERVHIVMELSFPLPHHRTHNRLLECMHTSFCCSAKREYIFPNMQHLYMPICKKKSYFASRMDSYEISKQFIQCRGVLNLPVHENFSLHMSMYTCAHTSKPS